MCDLALKLSDFDSELTFLALLALLVFLLKWRWGNISVLSKISVKALENHWK